MARMVKHEDGVWREVRSPSRRARGARGFVELVSTSPEALGEEPLCEIVLVSGRRLVVRESIDGSRLRQLVRVLEA